MIKLRFCVACLDTARHKNTTALLTSKPVAPLCQLLGKIASSYIKHLIFLVNKARLQILKFEYINETRPKGKKNGKQGTMKKNIPMITIISWKSLTALYFLLGQFYTMHICKLQGKVIVRKLQRGRQNN